MLEQNTLAGLLRGRLVKHGLGRGDVGLSGSHLVLVIDRAEFGELLPLLDHVTVVNMAGNEPAPDLEAYRTDIARFDASGPLSYKTIVSWVLR